tara:strand:- start:4299 stop:5513 length:1215 start_codon:yes stop_codon:yes gene_type:complete
MANEIHIPEKGNLYRIKETIDAIKHDIDANKEERSAFTSKVDEMQDALTKIEERCNALDAALPQGEKVFVPEGDNSRKAAVGLFGRAFSAARRAARGEEIPDPFQRAGGQTTSPASDGGVLVPTEVHDQVVRIIEEKSFARQICRVIPMSSDKMNIGTIATGPAIEWPDEGAAATADNSEVVFGDPQLDSSTLVALDSVSRELSEDSLVAIEPFLAELFSERIAKEENKQVFSSTTPFSGVVQSAGYSTTIAGGHYSTVTFDELVATKFAVDANVIGSGTWVMHPSVYQYLVTLKDGNNRPIYATNWGGAGIQNDLGSGAAGTTAMLLGSPVVLTTTMESTNASGMCFLAYGDFSYYGFGDRRALSVEFDDSVYFTSRKRAILVSERIACKTLVANAFAKALVA